MWAFSGPEDESGESNNGAKAFSSFSLLIFGVGEKACVVISPLAWCSVMVLRSEDMWMGVVVVGAAAAAAREELDERRMLWWLDAGSNSGLIKILRRSKWHACLDVGCDSISQRSMLRTVKNRGRRRYYSLMSSMNVRW